MKKHSLFRRSSEKAAEPTTTVETAAPLSDAASATPEKDEKQKKYTLLNILYGISGTFVAVCYLGYLFSILIQGALATLPIPLLVLALVILPVLLRKQLKKRLPRSFQHWKRLFCAGMCFYMVTFSIFSGVILFYGNSLPSEGEVAENETPVVVVFGCRAYGKTPGTTLRNRLDTAAALLEEFPDAICIVSGSQGENETLPEAEAMFSYLTEVKKFEESRVIREPEGSDSIENLSFSLKLLEDMEIENPKLICVSSEFHTPRILLIASRMGEDVIVSSAPSDGPLHLFTSLVREYMAYVKLFVFREV